MITAMEAARGAGAQISPLDFWSRSAEFDVLHLWGLEPQHRTIARWAQAARKKVLLSALVNYPGWQSWLRYIVSSTAGPARLCKPLLADLDWVTVVNQEQKRYLVKTIRYPKEQVSVVPNVIDDIFFDLGDDSCESISGLKDYVICAGNICKRKNQLSLVRACKQIGVPLLLAGTVLIGEEDYARAVVDAVGDDRNIRWIQGLLPSSRELASAYRHSALFALPSYSEQQPISALEAAACRKPLVLADRPYARQEFYENAALADPDSVHAISVAIRKALDHPEAYCPPASTLEQCRRIYAGAKYLAIYERLVHDSASCERLPSRG
jgi:glycosyltransferase involved in cell wall biosynthesis